MPNRPVTFALLMLLLAATGTACAESMAFDAAGWDTGDMNAQSPADSNGNIANSHIDYFYYAERLPMRMTLIDDSLADGSASRTYDSALLLLVVASDGLSAADSMRLFARRLSRDWTENGVSWAYHHAFPDSAWATAGGDISDLPCSDTVIIDTSITIGDTMVFHLDTGFVRSLIEGDNYGWLMMAENIVDRATFQVYTEDASSESCRPVLTVYYSETSSPSALLSRRRRLNP